MDLQTMAPQDPCELDDEEIRWFVGWKNHVFFELMIVYDDFMIIYGLLWLGNFFRNEEMLLVQIYIML